MVAAAGAHRCAACCRGLPSPLHLDVLHPCINARVDPGIASTTEAGVIAAEAARCCRPSAAASQRQQAQHVAAVAHFFPSVLY
jgi:hypothetical protein